jgi:hypothetical protein
MRNRRAKIQGRRESLSDVLTTLIWFWGKDFVSSGHRLSILVGPRRKFLLEFK